MKPFASVDFETTFFPKRKIGLKTMGVDQYLWHPEVDIYLVSVHTAEGSYVGDPVEFDWSQIHGLEWASHNAGFDRKVFRKLIHDNPSIAQYLPETWHCTANMAAWMGVQRSLKGAVQELFNYDLDKDARKKMENKTWAQMQGDGTSSEVMEYAERDALWCYKLWETYSDKWPTIERRISDTIVKQTMRGLPCDKDYIEKAVKNLEVTCWEAQKHLPWASGDNPKAVLSLIAVAEECRKIGIVPPTSLAEDDLGCREWEDEHPDIPWVREMRNYRKANLLRGKFAKMRDRIRPFDGRIDFSQKYCGAHTKRASGDSGFNVHGFQREPFLCGLDKKKQPIMADMRRAIHASDGGQIIVADLSQIEPRTLAWTTQDRVKLDLIEKGLSVYDIHAIQTMGWTGGKLKAEDPHKYALAKMRVLGLSYGCGWKRFIAYCRDLYNHIITAQESKIQVRDFRNKERKIRAFWNQCGNSMEASLGEDFEIELPSWNSLWYRGVHKKQGQFAATLATGRVNRLWGSLLVENYTQATARDCFYEKMVMVEDAGIPTLFPVHDEIVTDEVPDDQVREALEYVGEIMSADCDWMPGVKLDSEFYASPFYTK